MKGGVMAYTPELSQKHSGALRRIAWALEMPMTKAMDKVFDYIGKLIDSKKVCDACRDKTHCEKCMFNHRWETT